MSRLLVHIVAETLSLMVEIALTNHRSHDPGRQDSYGTAANMT